MEKRGLFITIEGGEGSGKSSLMEHLSRLLSERKLAHIFTREPGGTPFAERVRDLLLNSKETEGVNALSELLLFLAARLDHVEKIVEPALQKGTTVLCDRYIDSTVAYQGCGRGKDPDQVWKLCTGFVPLLPDITFFLDVAPEVGIERLNKREQNVLDRLESEKMEFHERVRAGFLALAKIYPERIVVVDASLPEEKLAEVAKDKLKEYLCT